MRWAACWLLYWLGHLTSRLMPDGPPWLCRGIYRVYNWLMLRSSDVQRAGPGPWRDA